MHLGNYNKCARANNSTSGVSVPRGQVSEELGSTLPSPRAISEALIADQNRPSADFTLMLMQWGQFLDHDITHTPLTKGLKAFRSFTTSLSVTCEHMQLQQCINTNVA